MTAPASARGAARDREHDQREPVGIDAHQARRHRVDRAGAHGAAGVGVLQENVHREQHQRGRAPDPQRLHRQDRVEQEEDAVAAEAREADRILAEEDQREAAQDDGDAERDGDLDELRAVAHRREREAFLRGAEQRAGERREQHRERQRDAHHVHPCRQQSAKHDELALRHVDDVGDVVAEHESERDQRIDAAGGQSRQQELRKDGEAHACPRSAPIVLTR